MMSGEGYQGAIPGKEDELLLSLFDANFMPLHAPGLQYTFLKAVDGFQ
jgi:hypothetical protein